MEECAIREQRSWALVKQRVNESPEFRPSRNVRNSIVLLRGGGEENARLWLAKVLLCSGWKGKETKKKGEYSFFQYKEYSLPRDNVDKRLGCVSLQWDGDDDTHHELAKTSCASGENSLGAVVSSCIKLF